MASTAAAASSADRLSQLSDDILTHILSFAPSREAARATALSRRWRRPLWLKTGAVNVDYRSYPAGGNRRRAVDDADHAYACLSSRGRVPKKLSVVMPDDAIVCAACDDEEDGEDTAGVQEEDADGVENPWLEWLSNGGLPRCTLPFSVLRVLELTGYDLQPYSDGRRKLAFPRLEVMRLRRCRTELDTLQDMISAAPKLADICLDALRFLDQDDHNVYSLRCEAATVMVMENCGSVHDSFDNGGCTVTLEAPRLRQFRYTQAGYLHEHTSFFFEWPRPHLEQLHVAVHSASTDATYLRRKILSNISHNLRYLKLTVYSIADLAEDYWLDFTNLERLEIEELCGWSVQNHRAAAKAVLNLLRSCPSLVELNIKFNWSKYLREINLDTADEMAAITDFLPCASVDNDDDDEGECCESMEDLHEEFCCRRKLGCLRRIVVEFDAEELTCFQVRLIKFLAKSAAALQEFVIDSGKGYDSSRVGRKVARWRRPPWSLSRQQPPPIWPPPLSEFPLLEVPLFSSDREINDDDDDGDDYDYDYDDYVSEVKEYTSLMHYVLCSEEEDDDDISPRHYRRNGRKKKKDGSLGCFRVKPKAKGLIMDRLRGGGAIGCRHHCSDFEERYASRVSPLVEETLPPRLPTGPTPAERPTPAEPWSAPLMYEFPLLRRAAPPAPQRPPVHHAHPAAAPRSSSPPESPRVNLDNHTPLPCSTNDNFSREWRLVSLTDLGIDVAASQRFSRHFPRRRRSPPSTFRHRLATFPGRPSRTMWRR